MSVATPNIDQMVARLTQLSPQMLQQYAAQHQNDTMALLAAKAASDAQKKIMSAGKPQQMGIPPKVNEQVVESIAQPQAPQAPMQSMQAPQAAPQAQGLPEDSGIAQLPAPNMQGMAGGGIVAFAGGGVNDAETFVDSLGIERNARTGDPVKSMFQRMGEFRDREQAKTAMPAVPVANAADQRMLRPALAPIAALATDERPYTERNLATRQPGVASLAGKVDAQAPAGPKLKLDGSGAGGSGTRAPQGGDLTSLLKKIQAAQGEPTDPEAASRKQLQASAEAMAGKELANAQTSKEGLAALLGGKESRIKGREDRAEKSENLNTKMAVINAGLAMMQSTGRGLAGIAEGATKGMGMYAEGLKLTAAERQKIEDAKDSFDELRFNSENMSRKDITAAENKITNAANITIQAGMDARDKNRSEKREDSSKVFTAEAAAQQGALNRAAQIQAAGMPSGQMQLAAALGKGDIEAGMRKITEIAAGKFSIQQAYADHLKAAGPGMGMTPQDFAAAMRAFTPPKPTTKPSGTAFD